MNREIIKIVNRVVSEEISDKISNVKRRIFEEKQEICNECGSNMYEGVCSECSGMNEEICNECGSNMYEGVCSECSGMYEGNIHELGGMDDGHPRFGKMKFKSPMSIEDIENLLRGDDEDSDVKNNLKFIQDEIDEISDYAEDVEEFEEMIEDFFKDNKEEIDNLSDSDFRKLEDYIDNIVSDFQISNYSDDDEFEEMDDINLYEEYDEEEWINQSEDIERESDFSMVKLKKLNKIDEFQELVDFFKENPKAAKDIKNAMTMSSDISEDYKYYDYSDSRGKKEITRNEYLKGKLISYGVFGTLAAVVGYFMGTMAGDDVLQAALIMAGLGGTVGAELSGNVGRERVKDEELEEEECNECGPKSDMYEAKKLSKGQKYIAKQAKPYDEIDGEDFKKLRSNKKEVKEKLYGRQKLIDKNNNNKIDGEDFKILRKESKFYFTESEMVDIIENIVKEEKKKSKSPSAQNVLKSSLGRSKKENDNYIKSVTKKMKDYLKDMSKGEYEENPTNFPEGNYDLDNRKEKLKKYTPSDAVDEYIDAFSYPGMTNLVYDEIKPNDEKIEKYIKGHRTTGNAVFDEDGKPLGNVVPSKVGDKLFKNYKENLYGQEQQQASYKRQTQPVDQAGEETEKGTLKSKKGKKTAQSVLNAVDESKESKKVISEMEKMKNLIGYNQKTQ